MPGPYHGKIPNIMFSFLHFHHYVKGPAPTSGPYGSGQAPVQFPFQPSQMGNSGPPGPHMSVIGANIQQMGPQMGQDFERHMNSLSSLVQSVAAGNYAPQAANPSSSRNVEGFHDPSINQVDEEASLEETDEPIPTAA